MRLKENNMRWIIFVMMMVICLLLVLCYALLVTAYEADERADRMYRKWKESKDDNSNDGERNSLER